MIDEWYYVRGDQRIGPISAAELKHLVDAGRIGPSDMVSKKGLGRWVAASSIKGLCDGSAAAKGYSHSTNEVIFADSDVTLTSSTLFIGFNEFDVRNVRAVDVRPGSTGSESGPIIAFFLACCCFVLGLFFAAWDVLINCIGGLVVLGDFSAIGYLPGAIFRTLFFYSAGRLLLQPARSLWATNDEEYRLCVTTQFGTYTCLVSSDEQFLQYVASKLNDGIGIPHHPLQHISEPSWVRFIRTRVPFVFRDEPNLQSLKNAVQRTPLLSVLNLVQRKISSFLNK